MVVAVLNLQLLLSECKKIASQVSDQYKYTLFLNKYKFIK